MVEEVSVFRTALLVLVLMMALPALLAQQKVDGGGMFMPVAAFDPARDAAADINAAVVEAKRTGKRVLIDVGGEWCIWCKRLDQFFLDNEDVADFLQRKYVTVKVNYSKENKNEAVLSRFPKVAGYPHLFVLDATGVLLHSQDSGKLEEGKGYVPNETSTLSF